MVRIAPFRGVFYNPKKIRDLSKVIAPPYDVISKEEQEKLYRRSPHNFVRLDLSQEPDSYDAVAQLFADWQADGIFERDETPAIYFLSQRFSLKGGEEKERQGFFALTQLEEFSSGAIRPHEKTLDAPKEERLRGVQLHHDLLRQHERRKRRHPADASSGSRLCAETFLGAGGSFAEIFLFGAISKNLGRQRLVLEGVESRWQETTTHRRQLQTRPALPHLTSEE